MNPNTDVFTVMWCVVGPLIGYAIGKGISLTGRVPVIGEDATACPVCHRRQLGDRIQRELHTMVCSGNEGKAT